MEGMSETPNPWQPSQSDPEPDPWVTRPRSELREEGDPTVELPADAPTFVDGPEASAAGRDAATAGGVPPAPVPPAQPSAAAGGPQSWQQPYVPYGAAPVPPQPDPAASPQPYPTSGPTAAYPTSAESAPQLVADAQGTYPQQGGYQGPAGYPGQPQQGPLPPTGGHPPYAAGQPYPAPPVPAKEPSGWAALFDVSFDRTDVAVRIARTVNILAMVAFPLGWLLWSIGLGSVGFAGGGAAILARFAFGWVPALVGIGLVRLLTEGVLALVRAADRLDEIAERSAPAASGDTDEA